MTQTMLEYMGGSWQSFSVDGSVYDAVGTAYEMGANYDWRHKRIWRWLPVNATAYVKLPDPSYHGIAEGGPIFFMENLDAATYGVKIYTSVGVYVGEWAPQNSGTYNRGAVFCLDREANLWTAFGYRGSGLNKLI